MSELFEVAIDRAVAGYDAWIANRRNSIGASEVAAALGINPYKSKYSLWLEKVDPSYTPFKGNDKTNLGNMLEPFVILMAQDNLGLEITPDSRSLRSIEFPFITASLDGYGVDNEGKRFCIDAKTTNSYVYTDGIPDYVLLQIQTQLLVTGYDYGFVAVLERDTAKFYAKKIDRDEAVIDAIKKHVSKFWFENVKGNVPPAMSANDNSELGKIYSRANNSAIVSTPEIEEKIYKLRHVREQQSYLDEERAVLEAEIKLFMAENNELVIPGMKGKITWKEQKSSRVDSGKLKELYPEISKEVMSETTTRIFRFSF